MKRLFSIFLCAILLITLLPVIAIAAEDATATTMKLVDYEGTVTVKNASGKKLKLTKEMRLYNNYQITTNRKSYAYISLDGTKAIKLDASSKVTISRQGRKLEIMVEKGKILFNVTEQLKKDETLNIRTSTMITGVRGTIGWMGVGLSQNSELHLLEGSTLVTTLSTGSGETKISTINQGQSITVTQTPQGGQKTDITDMNTDNIPGFVRTAIQDDPGMQTRIGENTNLNVSDIIKNADEILKQEEDQADQNAKEIQDRLNDQVTDGVDSLFGDSSSNTSDLPIPTYYHVTFQMNGHGDAIAGQSVIENGTVRKPADPTADGYTFDGWFKDAACTIAWDFTRDIVTEDTVLYAKWTVNKYTIQFVNEDGTVLQSSEIAYGEMPTYTGETPTKTATAQYSYSFNGWDAEIVAVVGDATYTATFTETVNKYTINFVNEDGTVLQSTQIAYGEMPKYTGETPTKAATAQYSYSFNGWDAEIVAVTGDATYTATFSETVNKYTIQFVNEDGTVLQSSEIAYGEMPKYTGETPTKTATAQYSYSFNGWDAEIVAVVGDATYTATFTETVNKYTINFVNEDGTVLQSTQIAYGEMPKYTGETPTKAATAQYSYSFNGWDAEIVAVTGDATYTATFTETVNKYTINFVNEDGTVLQSTQIAYGEMPKYTGETPTKAATAQYSYSFNGWDAEIVAVTGDATYTATFSETVNQYTIQFVNEDGTVLQSSQIAYGEMPTYTGETPTKTATAQYSYSFNGWDAEIVAVTGDATYTATFSETVNKYTIQFVNEDGTVLQSTQIAYGEMPKYTGETPTKTATAQYTYTFNGWDTEIVAVTGDATYTATFSETVNKYTIQFVNEDGTVLQSSQIAYGEMPTYTGETPTKTATAQYSYSFNGWDAEIVAVVGDATYTATFSETVNKYTIQFVNEDGTVLQSSQIAYGEMPTYTGETPTKTATAQYSYSFNGWDAEIVAVVGDATYTATFTETANKYTINFVNEDGTVLQSTQIAYGEMPKYTGETPTKAATAQYSYSFNGWDAEIVAVTGDATYTATFSETVNKYTINFVNEDGTVLQSTQFAYGEMPKYTGTTPTKVATAQYSYSFNGWDAEIVAVVGDATYTATFTETVNKYTINFVNEDGTVLQSTQIAYGEMPKYTGETPTKAATAQYSYSFNGWDAEIVAVTGDATYTATFSETVNKYTINFVNEDGTVLQSTQIAYGEMPKYTGETPTKAATAQYSYSFNGWDAEIVAVTGDATYTATFSETVNQYTIQFVNEDGTVLQSSQIAYGEMPKYTGETPTKTATAQYSYSFNGWDAEIVAVTGDATYTATFSETVNQYTIQFVNEDGTVLQSSQIAYGEMPTYTGETPTKTATAQYSYSFNGWDAEIVAVVGDATYTATFTETVNKYTINFVNEDGTVLQSTQIAYGEMPKYTGETPTKAATAQYSYSFNGWDAEIVAVTGDATYTATFSETVNKYTIQFVNEDGTVLQSSEIAYGEMPKYTGASPTKAATAQYSYSFNSWDAEIVAVTGDATYTATFSETVNQYTIQFVNEDGTVLQSSEIAYGEMPAYTGETPTKAATAQYSYSFNGWDAEIVAVTGDATYTATFSETVNQYTIQFVNEDGTVLQSSEIAYGEMPKYTGETPTKAATAQYSYSFSGWDTEIVAVTGDATYTATFSETVNKYTINFVNEDGTVLQSTQIAYGEMPKYTGETPTKAATAQYSYSFSGWDTEIVAVTGDATYTATFTETVNKYTVTFDRNGHTSSTTYQTVEYNGKVVLPDEPVDPGYVFKGWYKEPECTTAWDFENDVIIGTTTLYAKWIATTTVLENPTAAELTDALAEAAASEDIIAVKVNTTGTLTLDTLTVAEGDTLIINSGGISVTEATTIQGKLTIEADGALVTQGSVTIDTATGTLTNYGSFINNGSFSIDTADLFINEGAYMDSRTGFYAMRSIGSNVFYLGEFSKITQWTDGETLTLLGLSFDSVILHENMTILSGISVTLDLNGFAVELPTLEGADGAQYPQMLEIEEGASLTVTDSSDDEAGILYSGFEYTIANSGNFTLKSGAILNTHADSNNVLDGDAIRLFGTSVTTIDGGRVEAGGEAITIAAMSGDSSTIYINGGYIYGSDAAINKQYGSGLIMISGGELVSDVVVIYAIGEYTESEDWDDPTIIVKSGTLIQGDATLRLAAASATSTNAALVSGGCTFTGGKLYAKDLTFFDNLKMELPEVTGPDAEDYYMVELIDPAVEVSTLDEFVEALATGTASIINIPDADWTLSAEQSALDGQTYMDIPENVTVNLNSGSITIADGFMFNVYGTLNLSSSASITNNGTLTIASDDFPSGTLVRNNGIVTNNGIYLDNRYAMDSNTTSYITVTNMTEDGTPLTVYCGAADGMSWKVSEEYDTIVTFHILDNSTMILPNSIPANSLEGDSMVFFGLDVQAETFSTVSITTPSGNFLLGEHVRLEFTSHDHIDPSILYSATPVFKFEGTINTSPYAAFIATNCEFSAPSDSVLVINGGSAAETPNLELYGCRVSQTDVYATSGYAIELIGAYAYLSGIAADDETGTPAITMYVSSNNQSGIFVDDTSQLVAENITIDTIKAALENYSELSVSLTDTTLHSGETTIFNAGSDLALYSCSVTSTIATGIYNTGSLLLHDGCIVKGADYALDSAGIVISEDSKNVFILTDFDGYRTVAIYGDDSGDSNPSPVLYGTFKAPSASQVSPVLSGETPVENTEDGFFEIYREFTPVTP